MLLAEVEFWCNWPSIRYYDLKWVGIDPINSTFSIISNNGIIATGGTNTKISCAMGHSTKKINAAGNYKVVFTIYPDFAKTTVLGSNEILFRITSSGASASTTVGTVGTVGTVDTIGTVDTAGRTTTGPTVLLAIPLGKIKYQFNVTPANAKVSIMSKVTTPISPTRYEGTGCSTIAIYETMLDGNLSPYHLLYSAKGFNDDKQQDDAINVSEPSTDKTVNILPINLPITVTSPLESVQVYLSVNPKPDSMSIIDNAGRELDIDFIYDGKYDSYYSVVITKGNTYTYTFKKTNYTDATNTIKVDPATKNADNTTLVCTEVSVLLKPKPKLLLNITPLGEKTIWINKKTLTEACIPVADTISSKPCKNTGGILIDETNDAINFGNLDKKDITIQMDCYRDYSFVFDPSSTSDKFLFKFNKIKGNDCQKFIDYLDYLTTTTDNVNGVLDFLSNITCTNIIRLKDMPNIIFAQQKSTKNKDWEDLPGSTQDAWIASGKTKADWEASDKNIGYVTLEYRESEGVAIFNVSSANCSSLLTKRLVARKNNNDVDIYESEDNSYDTKTIELIPKYILLDIKPPGPKLLLIDEGTSYEQCINIDNKTLCEQYSTVKVCLKDVPTCITLTAAEKQWDDLKTVGQKAQTDLGITKDAYIYNLMNSKNHKLNIIVDGVRQTTSSLITYSNNIPSNPIASTFPLSISSPDSVETACKGSNRYKIVLPFEQKIVDDEIVYYLESSKPTLTINATAKCTTDPLPIKANITLIDLTNGGTKTGTTPYVVNVNPNSSYEARLSCPGFEPKTEYIDVDTVPVDVLCGLVEVYKYPVYFPARDCTLTITNTSACALVTDYSTPCTVFLEQGTYTYALVSNSDCYETYYGVIPLRCFIDCSQTPIQIKPILAPKNWRDKIKMNYCTIDDVMASIHSPNKNIFFDDYVIALMIRNSESEINNTLSEVYSDLKEFDEEVRDSVGYLRTVCIAYTCLKLLKADASYFENWDEWLNVTSQFEADYYTKKKNITDSKVQANIKEKLI